MKEEMRRERERKGEKLVERRRSVSLTRRGMEGGVRSSRAKVLFQRHSRTRRRKTRERDKVNEGVQLYRQIASGLQSGDVQSKCLPAH